MNPALQPPPDLPFELETDLERAITADHEWQAGLAWGTPRRGHPEGAVVWHVRDVLNNVEEFFRDSPERGRLRLIALVHDTFKYQVDRAQPRSDWNTHEAYARRFAERYTADTGVLAVTEMHDRAFKAHRLIERNGDAAGAERLARDLIRRLGEHLPLFRMFYLCDNRTGDKSLEHYDWFERITATAHPTTRAGT